MSPVKKQQCNNLSIFHSKSLFLPFLITKSHSSTCDQFAVLHQWVPRRINRNVSDRQHESHLLIMTSRGNYWHLADHISYLLTTSAQSCNVSGTVTWHSAAEQLLTSRTTVLAERTLPGVSDQQWKNSFQEKIQFTHQFFHVHSWWGATHPLQHSRSFPEGLMPLLEGYSSCKGYPLVQGRSWHILLKGVFLKKQSTMLSLGVAETQKDRVPDQKAAMFMLRDGDYSGKLHEKKSGCYQDYWRFGNGNIFVIRPSDIHTWVTLVW